MPLTTWEEEAKRILKAELARSGTSYKVLARKLGELGVEDSDTAIASKISRGKFSMAFFVQCMRAMNVDLVRFDDRKLK